MTGVPCPRMTAKAAAIDESAAAAVSGAARAASRVSVHFCLCGVEGRKSLSARRAKYISEEGVAGRTQIEQSLPMNSLAMRVWRKTPDSTMAPRCESG